MLDISRIVVNRYTESTNQGTRHVGSFWRARPVVVVQFVDSLYTPSSAAELARQAVSGIAIIDDRYDFDPDELFDLIVPFADSAAEATMGARSRKGASSAVGVKAETSEESKNSGGGMHSSRTAQAGHVSRVERNDNNNNSNDNSAATTWKAAGEAGQAACGLNEATQNERGNNNNSDNSDVMHDDEHPASENDEEEEEQQYGEYSHHCYDYSPARRPSWLKRLRSKLRHFARPEREPLTSIMTSEPQIHYNNNNNSSSAADDGNSGRNPHRWHSAGQGSCVRDTACTTTTSMSLQGGYVLFADSFIEAHPQSRIAALTQAYQRAHDAASSACCFPSSWLDVFFASMNKDTEGNRMRRCVREAERGVRPMFRRRPSSLAYGTASYITRE